MVFFFLLKFTFIILKLPKSKLLDSKSLDVCIHQIPVNCKESLVIILRFENSIIIFNLENQLLI